MNGCVSLKQALLQPTAQALLYGVDSLCRDNPRDRAVMKTSEACQAQREPGVQLITQGGHETEVALMPEQPK